MVDSQVPLIVLPDLLSEHKILLLTSSEFHKLLLDLRASLALPLACPSAYICVMPSLILSAVMEGLSGKALSVSFRDTVLFIRGEGEVKAGCGCCEERVR